MQSLQGLAFVDNIALLTSAICARAGKDLLLNLHIFRVFQSVFKIGIRILRAGALIPHRVGQK